MKNLAFLLLIGVFFTSCGSSSTETNTATSTDSSMCKVDSTCADTACVDTAKK